MSYNIHILSIGLHIANKWMHTRFLFVSTLHSVQQLWFFIFVKLNIKTPLIKCSIVKGFLSNLFTRGAETKWNLCPFLETTDTVWGIAFSYTAIPWLYYGCREHFGIFRAYSRLYCFPWQSSIHIFHTYMNGPWAEKTHVDTACSRAWVQNGLNN